MLWNLLEFLMHSHQRRASKTQQSLRFRVQKTTVWWRQEGNNSRFGHKTSTWWIRQVPISGPGSQERGPNVDSRALENTVRQRSSVEKRIIIVQIKDFALFSAAVNKPGAETLPFWDHSVELPSQVSVLLSSVYRHVAHVVSQAFPILLHHSGLAFSPPDQITRLIFISVLIFSQFSKFPERSALIGKRHLIRISKSVICIYDLQKRIPIKRSQ